MRIRGGGRLRAAIFSGLLGLASTAGTVSAAERWLYLGDSAPSLTWPAGKLSINLNSLRQRGRHYEIWERVVFGFAGADAAQRWDSWVADGGPPQRNSLWAIRCKRGAMALVTSGAAGSFEPRPEKLNYYVPVPATAGAAVLQSVCAEVRRIAPEPPLLPEALPDDPLLARRVLERPPGPVDDGESEEGDED